jgi:hypothetical protein
MMAPFYRQALLVFVLLLSLLPVDRSWASTEALNGRRLFFTEAERTSMDDQHSVFEASSSAITDPNGLETSSALAGSTTATVSPMVLRDTQSNKPVALVKYSGIVTGRYYIQILINALPCRKVHLSRMVADTTHVPLDCPQLPADRYAFEFVRKDDSLLLYRPGSQKGIRLRVGQGA